MRSPALAIGWDLWRQHRPWLLPVVAWVVLIDSLLYNAAPAGSLALFDPLLVSVPAVLAMFCAVGTFSFGMTADLAARRSGYPARAFTLPVSSATLAWWPMAYGTAAVLTVWLFGVWLPLRRSGVELPLVWPALLLAAVLAWS